MSTLNRTAVWLVATSLALAVSSCSADSDSSSPGSASGHGPVDACKLVTKDDVAAALGMPVDYLQDPAPGPIADPEDKASGTRTCSIATDPVKPLQLGRSGGFTTTTVRWFPTAAEASDRFSTEKTVMKDTADVSGVGDAAFEVAGEIHVVAKDVFVVIHLDGVDAGVQSERLKTLATAAVQRL